MFARSPYGDSDVAGTTPADLFGRDAVGRQRSGNTAHSHSRRKARRAPLQALAAQ